MTLADLQRLQQEAGQAENELRLRAIIAERQVQELTKQVAGLLARLEPKVVENP